MYSTVSAAVAQVYIVCWPAPYINTSEFSKLILEKGPWVNARDQAGTLQ